jgi:hypothetical protein
VSEDSVNAPHNASQPAGTHQGPRMLHADVETWTDTCSCEPEPRWQAVAEELEAQARADTTGDPAAVDGRGARGIDPPASRGCGSGPGASS